MESIETTLARIALTCLLLIAPAASAAGASGDYNRSPVYYEIHGDSYSNEKKDRLLRQGIVLIPPYEPVEMTQFDWRENDERDFTWAIQMHELRFLLPLIASDSDDDRALAREYFMGWHDAHPRPRLRDRAVRYPMSVAFRAMVFVYYLKREEHRSDPDAELIRILRQRIEAHQELLADDRYYEGNSNHGLVEGMALLETTRVIPSSELRALGLERMLQITRLSVSELGAHMEHAPFYHFVFLRWLDGFASYLDTVPDVPAAGAEELRRYRDAMQSVAYYLHDHAGMVAPIGDSHPVPVEPPYVAAAPADGDPVFYDEVAGYAVYKGSGGGGDRRYVVFANQNRKAALRFHYHNDAMSVFLSDDGETLLADPGAFTYTTGRHRSFFASGRAHNRIYEARTRMVNQFRPIEKLRDVGMREDDDGVSFWGTLSFTSGRAQRHVHVPSRERVVVIADTIRVKTSEHTGRARRALDARMAYAMTWNVGPGVVLEPRKTGTANRHEWLLTTKRGRSFALTVRAIGADEPDALTVEFMEGQEHPLFGWHAPRFGAREPLPVLVFAIEPYAERMCIETRVAPTDG